MHGGIAGSISQWSDENFGPCALGDARRTRRAVVIARSMALRSAASIPMQAQTPRDAKAAYRFFDTPAVTFQKLAGPHWELTRARAAEHERVLVIQDTTALSFSDRRDIEGLGPIGHRVLSQGLWLHNALMVTDEPTPQVLGLACQEIWARTPAPAGETETQRHRRPRESQRWARIVRDIGACGAARVLHVCDREADLFELYEACLQSRVGFVVRIHTAGGVRRVYDGHQAGSIEVPLTELIQATAPWTTTSLELRARPGRAARRVELKVSARAWRMPPPRIRDRRGTRGIAAIPVWGVRAWEPDPPEGVEPLEWTLVTSEPVETEADALRVLGWYRSRWLIEEYHKCLKSGCAVEDRQLETADRLKPLVALLAVTAVRLLQLKQAARQMPERPAEQIVPEEYLRVLGLYRRDCAAAYTCRSFWRAVAMMGGFMGRKHDGDPGWLTLWRGWQQLELLVVGAQLHTQMPPRCGE